MKIFAQVFAVSLAGTLSIASADDQKFDNNSDGRLDVEERQAKRSLEKIYSKTSRTKKTTATITRKQVEAEIEKRRNNRFLEADSDGDRNLSEKEFRSIPAASRLSSEEVAKIFSSLDHNRDRQISLREVGEELEKVKTKTKASSGKVRPAKTNQSSVKK